MYIHINYIRSTNGGEIIRRKSIREEIDVKISTIDKSVESNYSKYVKVKVPTIYIFIYIGIVTTAKIGNAKNLCGILMANHIFVFLSRVI